MAVILNEAAVKALGWKDPVGKAFHVEGWPGHVIGVVKDFHFDSLQEEIRPLFMKYVHHQRGSLSLRLNSEDLAETMDFVRKTWMDIRHDRPFTYQFLDEKLEAAYRSDERASQMFFVAASLAILIACMGLIGLASFSAEQRAKEIGIRKALGATAAGLVALFTRDFIKLVTLANVLVLPLSMYMTQLWLNEFAYRIEPGASPFVLSAAISLVIAAVTVFATTFGPATTAPVNALRGE